MKQELKGYLHCVSPVINAKRSSSQFFDCQIQIGENKMIRGVCFSPPKRDKFQHLSTTGSPIKIRRFNLNDTENEVLMFKEVELSQLNDFREFERMDIAPNQIQPIANLQKLALQQLVTIKAKVARIESVKKQKIDETLTLDKQDIHVLDNTGTIVVTLWGKHIQSCELGLTYIFKNLRLRQKSDGRYLNIPKEQDIEVTFEQTEPLEGELASADLLPPITEVTQIALISGVSSISSYKACPQCSKKVKIQSQKRASCAKCNMDIPLKRCTTYWYLRLFLQGGESKQKLHLTVYQPGVQKIAELLKLDLETVDKDTLLDSISDMDEVLVTYDNVSKKLTHIELFSME